MILWTVLYFSSIFLAGLSLALGVKQGVCVEHDVSIELREDVTATLLVVVLLLGLLGRGKLIRGDLRPDRRTSRGTPQSSGELALGGLAIEHFETAAVEVFDLRRDDLVDRLTVQRLEQPSASMSAP